MDSPVIYSTESSLVHLNKVHTCNKTFCHFPYPCDSSQQCGPIKIVFPKGKYHIKLCAAKGGDHSTWDGGGIYHGVGGSGSCSQGTISFKERQTTYLLIGGRGVDAKLATVGQKKGGYNGGGKTQGNAGSGGGATDLRLSHDSHDSRDSLESRLIVAGGGGGGNDNTNGGDGGGIEGLIGEGDYPGTGATQTGPGLQYESGTFGFGGSLEDTPDVIDGGSGGGGYYGGGRAQGLYSSGGGGSGFVSGMDGCVSISQNPDSPSVHSSGFFFKNPSMAFETNRGDGYAEISLLLSPTNHNLIKKRMSLMLISALFTH